MDDEIIFISENGCIDCLYRKIREKSDVLSLIDKEMFEDTPLHIAASRGHSRFAMEVMNLMPSFARKLNKDGLSPMHLALLGGHHKLVLSFLHAVPDLARVKGRGGMTPLHYAAEKGYCDPLIYFLFLCPSCIEDINVNGETVVHIAVRENKLEVLEVLVRWLRRVCLKDAFKWKAFIGKWRDDQNRTAFDIAEHKKQIKAIKLLAEIDAENSRDLEAVGFLQCQSTKLRIILGKRPHSTEQEEASSLGTRKPPARYLRAGMWFDERFAVYIERLRLDLSDSMRAALLVVAGVMLAASYQTAFSPPGGFGQINGDHDVAINGTYINSTVTSTSTQGTAPSVAEGKVVLKPLDFAMFVTTNGLVLYGAIWMIVFLLTDTILSGFLLYLFLSYGISVYNTAPNKQTQKAFYWLFVLLSISFFFIFLVYLRGKWKIHRVKREIASSIRRKNNVCNEENAAGVDVQLIQLR